ncbi:hypothetical protein CPT_Sonora_055 [Stenotrophomonas phage Sonora]|nr:hypothetical protein CPT_Sonora_055 [Stenotrophomonas phage Sonora]
MTIVFRNNGELDLTSIRTFGVSSKESSSAIGFFGTGLKYAIAIFLRLGCKVEINTGGQRLVFGTERATVRVNDFDFVTMNGERLGFTTELGKTWEAWAALRELYCNCMDEKGEVYEVDESVDVGVSQYETVILVEGRAISDVWAERSTIFLSKPPAIVSEGVDIHLGASRFLFYRGIRVMKLEKPSQFTYNIKRRLDLTEDRTLKYPWMATSHIDATWAEAEDVRLLEAAITAPEGTLEHDLSFGGAVPSEEFLGLMIEMRRMRRPFSVKAWGVAKTWAMDRIINEFEETELNELDRRRLDKAIGFVERIGFPVREYPIRVTSALGPGVLGQALEGTIYLSPLVMLQGTKMLAGTLIEEFIHLKFGCADETREMQNILMDTIASLGEQLVGEPL